MKFYLASSSGIPDTIEDHADKLRAHNHYVVSNWHEVPDYYKSLAPHQIWNMCFSQILISDAVIGVSAPNLRGALLEIGYAIALSKPIYLIGEFAGDWHNMSQISGRYSDLDDFIGRMKWHE